jgi:para-aminobenzoate synthetase/4-amino-4-deoxychorismate lyase
MSTASRPPQLWAAFDFPRHPLAREDGERLRGAFFVPPDARLVAREPAELRVLLRRVQAAARDGAWVLGGLRYEAAAALEPVLSHHPAEAPLAEFALWHSAPQAWPASLASLASSALRPTGPQDLGPWQDRQTEAAEAAQVQRIRDYIRAGDCYQVNLTTRLDARPGPDFELADYFFALHAAQPGGFALYLRDPAGGGVASVSPELFFDWRPLPEAPEASQTWLLSTQPMKGTAPRGRDRAEDEAAQAHLRTSAKERAENLMIVDLLRNDLSRLAVTGSVRVPRLFELHALPTVWQMTSTISAISRAGLGLDELLAALFPCGSVTGAPKRRAMQLIEALEPGPRGWYCGALGLLQPGGIATFNVPIRTVEQGADGRLHYGVGSGITLDSEPEAEIAEWRAKTRLLLRAQAPIAGLETLRLAQGQFAREPRHQARLQRCARHFGLAWSGAAWRAKLAEIAAQHPEGLWRVRLTLARDGQLAHEIQPLAELSQPVRVALAPQALDTQGPGAEFLQHKTTRREAYQQMLAHKPADCFDLLLFNREGELTEGCISNLALRLDGQWLTPRLPAGLLPGVMREELLEQGRLREARLTLDDLRRADGLALFNSVRGWLDARLAPQD